MSTDRQLLPFDAGAVIEACRELDEWRVRLDSRGALLRAWDGRLRRDLEAAAVAASTSMEGVPVTLDEVRRILARDRPSKVSPADRELVEGYRQATGYVLRRSDDPNFRWDRELLVGLHDLVLAGHHGAGAGRLRTVPRQIVSGTTGRVVFEAAAEADVPALVDAACRTLERGFGHPAPGGGLAARDRRRHASLPGRERARRPGARLAGDASRGGPPSRVHLARGVVGTPPVRPLRGLLVPGLAVRPGSDVTPFVRAHVRAQLSQVRALDMRERILRRVYTAMLTLLEAAAMDPRVVNALWDAFFGFAVPSGYYAAIADVSRATAAATWAGRSRPGSSGPRAWGAPGATWPRKGFHLAWARRWGCP
jgi:hypothetical protein